MKKSGIVSKMVDFEEQASKWLLLSGVVFLLIGLFVDFSFLSRFGHEHLDYNLPLYLRYVSFIKPLCVLLGCLLFFSMLFKNRLIDLYHSGRIKPEILLATLLVASFCVIVFVAYVPFRNHAFSMDEYNFLYQAKIFSKGRLFIDAPDTYKPFVEQYMILNEGKLFSKYPPGYSLFLSLGERVGLPGIVNPLLAVVTLFLIYYLVKSFWGPGYGILSVALMSTTPYFIAYSASYYSHPTSLLMTVLILFCIRRYELSKSSLYLILTGLCAGYSFLTRPLDSFCILVPAGIYLLYAMYKNGDLKKIGYPLIFSGGVFLLFILYNYILINHVSIATYPIVDGEFRVVDPEAGSHVSSVLSILTGYLRNAVQCMPKLLLRYLLLPCAIFIPLFASVGVFHIKSVWKWILLANFMLLVFLYNFHYGIAWPLYGARYYYSGYAALVILATGAMKPLVDYLKKEKIIYHFFSFVFIVHILFSVSAIWDYSFRFKLWEDIDRDIIQHCPEKSIVVLRPSGCTPKNAPDLRTNTFIDLVDAQRNPFMTAAAARLFVIKDDNYNIPKPDLEKIQTDFPDFSICHYDFSFLRNKNQ